MEIQHHKCRISIWENAAFGGANSVCLDQPFLAHLAQCAKVRYLGGPVSVVRRRVSCVVNIYINIISSETTGQNLTKLNQKHPWGRGNKRYRTEF